MSGTFSRMPLVPVITDKETAPDKLLKIIRCKWKTVFLPLKCVAACRVCLVTECQNGVTSELLVGGGKMTLKTDLITTFLKIFSVYHS